jgi:hypothetical protein
MKLRKWSRMELGLDFIFVVIMTKVGRSTFFRYIAYLNSKDGVKIENCIDGTQV